MRESELEALGEKLDQHREETRIDLEQLARDLRRELAALVDNVSGWRREQRDQNVRLYERWERHERALAQLEATVSSLRLNGGGG